jgi:peptide chain release factor
MSIVIPFVWRILEEAIHSMRADFLQQFKFSLHIRAVYHDDRLIERMRALGVRGEDLEESFSRSGGAGGQNVNKVSTAATIRHSPSGLAVTASDSRSQSANRHLALTRLLDLFEKQKEEKLRVRLAAASKARSQRARRSRAAKEKLVDGKRRRGETKKLRGKIDF